MVVGRAENAVKLVRTVRLRSRGTEASSGWLGHPKRVYRSRYSEARARPFVNRVTKQVNRLHLAFLLRGWGAVVREVTGGARALRVAIRFAGTPP